MQPGKQKPASSSSKNNTTLCNSRTKSNINLIVKTGTLANAVQKSSPVQLNNATESQRNVNLS